MSGLNLKLGVRCYAEQHGTCGKNNFFWPFHPWPCWITEKNYMEVFATLAFTITLLSWHLSIYVLWSFHHPALQPLRVFWYERTVTIMSHGVFLFLCCRYRSWLRYQLTVACHRPLFSCSTHLKFRMFKFWKRRNLAHVLKETSG